MPTKRRLGSRSPRSPAPRVLHTPAFCRYGDDMYDELPHTGFGALVLTVVGLTSIAIGAAVRFAGRRLSRA